MPSNNDLTMRQNILLGVFLSDKKKWFKSKEIYDLMAMSMSPYAQPSSDAKFWSEVGEDINADVDAINKKVAAQGQAVISNRAKGYKLANREEYERYSDLRYESIIRSLAALSEHDSALGYDRRVKKKYRDCATIDGSNPGSAMLPESNA